MANTLFDDLLPCDLHLQISDKFPEPLALLLPLTGNHLPNGTPNLTK